MNTVSILYLFFLIFFLILMFGIMILYVYMVIGDLMGAPFVPTSSSYLDEIFKKANLKKGQRFIDLGSGDGRLVRKAAKNYGALGVGIEISPILVWYSKILTKFQKIKGAKFKTGNFFKTPLGSFDIIFCFLVPKSLPKLENKLLKEAKGKLVISQGFKLKGLENYLDSQITRKVFSTYFYRIPNSDLIFC